MECWKCKREIKTGIVIREEIEFFDLDGYKGTGIRIDECILCFLCMHKNTQPVVKNDAYESVSDRPLLKGSTGETIK